MDRRKTKEADRWMRFMHPSYTSGDTLFDSLCQAYLAIQPETSSEYAGIPNHIKHIDPLHFLSHLDTTTTADSCDGLNRSSSSGSLPSLSDNRYGLTTRADGFNAVLVSGLTSCVGAIVSTRKVRSPGAFQDTFSAFTTGCLTASSRVLLHGTPLVGDVSSIAVFALIQRSRDPARSRSTVWGYSGAVLGARIADIACRRTESRDWVRYVSMMSLSLLGNYLCRGLSDYYFSTNRAGRGDLLNTLYYH